MRFVSSCAIRLSGSALTLAVLLSPGLAQAPLDPFGGVGSSDPVEARPADRAQTRGPYLAPMKGSWSAGDRPTPDGGATPDVVQPSVPQYELPAASDDEHGRAVERAELAPVMASDGSDLPYELWRGLSAEQVESMIAALEIPPHSVALHALWRRLITSDVTPPTNTTRNARFLAVRVEALDRSGLLDEAAALLARDHGAASDPVVAALLARSEIGLGNRERGCEIARDFSAVIGALPSYLKGQTVLISGYCAALVGDLTTATLSAGLARELGLEGEAGPNALDAIGSGASPARAAHGKVSLLDYRILDLVGGVELPSLIANATPGLLAALALSPATAPSLRLAAGEAAALTNAITAEDLALLYRASQAEGGEPAAARAALFTLAEKSRTPLKKARLIREFLDDAQRAGLYWPALQVMARPARALVPVPELGWFAETAIETSLAVQDFENARMWAAFGSAHDQYAENGGLLHWMALIDITDPSITAGRSAHLASVERMALSGRFSPVLLHRLASVLDALDINVPIPLWDLASRAPQPAGGHLPDTGVLSELADASMKKEFGRTVLLSMRALGSSGAEAAHILALGDVVRALKRAGLVADACRLALEALFAGWPRSVSN